MGTIEQKLNYLKATKRFIGNQIKNLGGNITTSTPFRDYVGELANLYGRIPKTTFSSGTSINLGTTLKGKLDYDLEDDKYIMGLGNTSQESTTGKNLLKPYNTTATTHGITKSFDEATQTYTFNGTCNQDNTTFLLTDTNITFVNNQTKVIAYWVNGSVTNYCTLRFLNDTYGRSAILSILDLSSSNTKLSATTTSDFDCPNGRATIRFDNGSVANNLKVKIMVTNSTNEDFEPYTYGASPNPNYPQPISVVTGTQEVVVRGKNLFNGTLYNGQIGSNGAFSSSTTRITNVTSETATSGSTDFLKKGTYTLSIDNLQNCTLLTKNSSGTILENFANSWQTLPFTFTLTQDGYVYFTARKSDNSTLTPSDYKAQIETGEMATSFESYITPTTTTLDLKTTELCKIGDYQDRLLYDISSDKWYKEKYIGKTPLKSTLGWQQAPSSVAEGTSRFYCNKDDVANMGSVQTKDVLSNSFIALSWNEIFITNTTTKNAISNYSQADTPAHRIVLRIENSYASTVNELNSFLDNNDIYAYYKLQTSTLTEITDENLIDQLYDIWGLMCLEGTTIIEVSGNLAMNLKIRALKGE